MHELSERGLIKVEKKSRTRILTTTPRFEEYFETKRDELKKNLEEIKEEERLEKEDENRIEEIEKEEPGEDKV